MSNPFAYRQLLAPGNVSPDEGIGVKERDPNQSNSSCFYTLLNRVFHRGQHSLYKDLRAVYIHSCMPTLKALTLYNARIAPSSKAVSSLSLALYNTYKHEYNHCSIL